MLKRRCQYYFQFCGSLTTIYPSHLLFNSTLFFSRPNIFVFFIFLHPSYSFLSYCFSFVVAFITTFSFVFILLPSFLYELYILEKKLISIIYEFKCSLFLSASFIFFISSFLAFFLSLLFSPNPCILYNLLSFMGNTKFYRVFNHLLQLWLLIT